MPTRPSDGTLPICGHLSRSACRGCTRCTRCCEDYGECRICASCSGRIRTYNRYATDPTDPNMACRACARCLECCTAAGICRGCPSCNIRQVAANFCSTHESCRDCCHCWRCAACSTFRPTGNRRCSACGTCRQCCACQTCSSCQARRCLWCPVCDLCTSHCQQADIHADEFTDLRPESVRPKAALIAFVKRDLRFWDAAAGQFTKNTLKRHLSVEIECDRVDATGDGKKLRNTLKYWGDSVVTDGSLSGSNSHEINTMPSNGDLFIEHIEQISEAYKNINGGCSEACGLHVHVNCSDLKFYDLRKVILLYAKVEKALFELCAPRRASSRYAMLCGKNYANMAPKPEDFKRQLLGKFYRGGQPLSARPDKQSGLQIKKAKTQKYGDTRYRALNLHSYFLRKSIEFRHHEGSTDALVITNWAMICGHVIEAANRLSEAEITGLPTDTRKALLAILPENLVEFCKETWKKNGKIVWADIEDKSVNRPDLPTIPAAEAQLDRKGWRRKMRAEKKAKAKIGEFRIRALRAIITGQRLNVSPPVNPTPTPNETPASR